MITKTYWQNGEEFSITEDFNRIKNNISSIHDLAERIFGSIPYQAIPEKTFSDFYFVDDCNNIEKNLQAIIDAINIPNLFKPTKELMGNVPIWDAKDINRIESTTLAIRNYLTNANKLPVVLATTLGGTIFDGKLKN